MNEPKPICPKCSNDDDGNIFTQPKDEPPPQHKQERRLTYWWGWRCGKCGYRWPKSKTT